MCILGRKASGDPAVNQFESLRKSRGQLAHELRQNIFASSSAECTTGLKEVHAINFPS